MAPVLHLRTPYGGNLPPDADAWTLAASLLPPTLRRTAATVLAAWSLARAHVVALHRTEVELSSAHHRAEQELSGGRSSPP